MLSRLLTRREQLVMTLVACSTVVGSGALYWRYGRPADDNPSFQPAPATEDAPAQAEDRAPRLAARPPVEDTAPLPLPTVTVSVRGAVRRPAVYQVPADSRIQDLLLRAGGPLEEADLGDINLAARLIDGTTLIIPEKPAAGAPRIPAPSVPNLPEYTISGWRNARPPADAQPGAAPPPGARPGGLIDINTASQAELETLPGIGPVLARAIIDYRAERPFRTVDELANVRGIGEKRLEAVRSLVTVR